MADRAALLRLDGWHGYSESPVTVVGETPKRYRIAAAKRTKLAGRNRWLAPGESVLVPKSAIKFDHPPAHRSGG